jgi:hypothetical protein
MNCTKWLFLVATLFVGQAFGQTIVYETPVAPIESRVVYYPPTPAPVVVNSPVVSGQTVWYSPPATTYAPSVTVQSPTVVGYAPAYSPTVVGSPATVYRPTVVSPYTTVMPYSSYYVSQPKVYVPGQPVRNVLRWAAP